MTDRTGYLRGLIDAGDIASLAHGVSYGMLYHPQTWHKVTITRDEFSYLAGGDGVTVKESQLGTRVMMEA